MKRILLLGTAREGSSRLKNKMLLPIYKDKTLFDFYVEKFQTIQKYNTIFSDICMAIYPGDKKLWKKANESGLKIIKRTKA